VDAKRAVDSRAFDAQVKAQVDGHPTRVLLAAVRAQRVVVLGQRLEKCLWLEYAIVFHRCFLEEGASITRERYQRCKKAVVTPVKAAKNKG
jgi:hypothetical protein